MYYVTNFNSVNDVFNKHRSTFTSANNLNVVTAEQNSESTYPLTNIGYFSDSKYVIIEVSLAGFDKDDIKVRYNGSIICIEAEYTDKNICKCTECLCNEELTYIQKNIPTKDVNRKIYLNNNYIGAKVRSSFKNGILKILVVPTVNYEDISIGGLDQHCSGKKHKNKHNSQCQQSQQNQQMPQMPFMPYPMVYPMPVMPMPCMPPNPQGGNGGNGGNSSSDDMIRIDDGDISLIFGDDLNEYNPSENLNGNSETSDNTETSDSEASNSETTDNSEMSDNQGSSSDINNTDDDEPLSHEDISSLFGD